MEYEPDFETYEEDFEAPPEEAHATPLISSSHIASQQVATATPLPPTATATTAIVRPAKRLVAVAHSAVQVPGDALCSTASQCEEVVVSAAACQAPDDLYTAAAQRERPLVQHAATSAAIGLLLSRWSETVERLCERNISLQLSEGAKRAQLRLPVSDAAPLRRCCIGSDFGPLAVGRQLLRIAASPWRPTQVAAAFSVSRGALGPRIRHECAGAALVLIIDVGSGLPSPSSPAPTRRAGPEASGVSQWRPHCALVCWGEPCVLSFSAQGSMLLVGTVEGSFHVFDLRRRDDADAVLPPTWASLGDPDDPAREAQLSVPGGARLPAYSYFASLSSGGTGGTGVAASGGDSGSTQRMVLDGSLPTPLIELLPLDRRGVRGAGGAALLDASSKNKRASGRAAPLPGASGGRAALPVGAGLAALLPTDPGRSPQFEGGLGVGGGGLDSAPQSLDAGPLTVVSVSDRGAIDTWMITREGGASAAAPGAPPHISAHGPSSSAAAQAGLAALKASDPATASNGVLDFGRGLGSPLSLMHVSGNTAAAAATRQGGARRVAAGPGALAATAAAVSSGPFVTAAAVNANDSAQMLVGTLSGEVLVVTRVASQGGKELPPPRAFHLSPPPPLRAEAPSLPPAPTTPVLLLSSCPTRPHLFLAAYADGTLALFDVRRGLPKYVWQAPWVRAVPQAESAVSTSPVVVEQLGWPAAARPHAPAQQQRMCPRPVGLAWLPAKSAAFLAVDSDGFGAVWDLGRAWPACFSPVAALSCIPPQAPLLHLRTSGTPAATASSGAGTKGAAGNATPGGGSHEGDMDPMALVASPDATAAGAAGTTALGSGAEDDPETLLCVSVSGGSDLLRGTTLVYASTSRGRVVQVPLCASLCSSEQQAGEEEERVEACLSRMAAASLE